MEISKRQLIIGIVLAILLLLVTVNSTYFFLAIKKVRVIEWIVFNACAPSNIAFLICFVLFLITRNKVFLPVAILPLFFFGTMGLFIFPWNGMNIIAQVSHILMTICIFWSLWVVIESKDYKSLAIGLIVSIVIFVPFISFDQIYARMHPEELLRILQIN
jgi:hypothetical protein